MSGEKRPRRTAAQIRRDAYVEALGYLAYRIKVCREGLEKAESSTGPTSRGAATERSALFEVQLIQDALAVMADQRPTGREFKTAAARRAAYLVARPAPVPTDQEEG